MRNFSAGTELKRLQQVTTQCQVQALIAREHLAELAESAVRRPAVGDNAAHQRRPSADDARSAPTATDDGAAASRGRLKEQSALSLVNAKETQIARQELQLTNDQRQIASAALVKLSRSLCDITAALIRETREKLGRIQTQERFL